MICGGVLLLYIIGFISEYFIENRREKEEAEKAQEEKKGVNESDN